MTNQFQLGRLTPFTDQNRPGPRLVKKREDSPLPFSHAHGVMPTGQPRQDDYEKALARLVTNAKTPYHVIPDNEDQTFGINAIPRIDQIRITGQGAIVSTAMFGPNARLKFRIESGSNGPQVVIFAERTTKTEGDVRRSFDRTLERDWISKNKRAFAGLWVALKGDRLLASGPSAVDVYRAARADSDASPYVAYLDAKEPPIFAGW